MAEAHVVGSSWDQVMTSILGDNKYVDVNRYVFEHELTTMDTLLNKSPGLMEQLMTWGNALDEPPVRSAALAANYRILGNKFFTDTETYQDPMALEFYTKAIYASPEDSAELALAHANRAAVLWRLKFYQAGYYDCQMAIEHGYPHEKMLKLLQRKKRFAVECANNEYIVESFDELIQFMRNNDMSAEDIASVENGRPQASNNSLNMDLNLEEFSQKELVEHSDEAHGRYITAKSAIAPDDIILSEKAYAFVPVHNDYESKTIPKHCENCASTNIIPFPCYVCARATYCSPRCLAQHEPIHRYECSGYANNLWKKIGIAHLALRNLVSGFETTIKGMDETKKLSPMEYWVALMARAEHDKDYDYGHVLRLCTNFPKMNSADLLQYALTAAMLISHLMEQTFFFELNDEFYSIMSHNDWVLLAGGLLMRHMGQLVSNGHAISEMEFVSPTECGECLLLPNGKVVKGQLSSLVSSTRVFTAIFPRISLFNHSCDPNIRNCFQGLTLTVRAARRINENDEVFNCYGPNFKLMGRAERQDALAQQYCFRCDCSRCSTNDDTADKYLSCFCQNPNCRVPLSLNEKEKMWWCNGYDYENNDPITCTKCHGIFDINARYLQYINRNLFMDQSFYSDDMRKRMLEHYAKASECLNEFHEQRQNFAQIILATGVPDNKQMCRSYADVTLDNLNASRERFGTHSMEFVMAATYVLDFLMVIKDRADAWSDDPEEYAALQLVDLREIRRSFNTLSTRTKEVFDGYISELQK